MAAKGDGIETHGHKPAITESRNLWEQIQTLIELQRVEVEIRQVKTDLAGVDQRLAELDEEARLAERSVADGSDRIAGLKKRYRALEGESQGAAAQVSRSREKLRMVKTNKEYQSGLKEIEDLESHISGIEDEMLVVLEELDAAESDLASLQESAARTAEQARGKQEQVRLQASRHRERLDRLESRLAEVRESADGQLLKRFMQVKRGQGDGLALVPVRRAVCQGCNVNIPPQMYNELHRGDRLEHCPNCQRLIYVEPAPEEASAEEQGKRPPA